MFKINPALNNALQIKGISFNSEALLAHQTDVVFVAKGNPDVEAYHQANLPVLEMVFTDYPSLEHSVSATANVLGTEQAQQRAVAYNRYLEESVAAVLTKTVSLSEQQRPSVLHIQSLNPLKVDGSNTLIDAPDYAGRGEKNAAQTISGNMKEVSPEQVLAPATRHHHSRSGLWRDIPIPLCATVQRAEGGTREEGVGKPGWCLPVGSLRHRKRVADPVGGASTASGVICRYRYGEHHPRLLPSLFDYPLNRDEAARILHGQPPA